MNEEQKNLQTEFIRNGIAVGFTDAQLIFMWEYMMMSVIRLLSIKR